MPSHSVQTDSMFVNSRRGRRHTEALVSARGSRSVCCCCDGCHVIIDGAVHTWVGRGPRARTSAQAPQYVDGAYRCLQTRHIGLQRCTVDPCYAWRTFQLDPAVIWCCLRFEKCDYLNRKRERASYISSRVICFIHLTRTVEGLTMLYVPLAGEWRVCVCALRPFWPVLFEPIRAVCSHRRLSESFFSCLFFCNCSRSRSVISF